MVMVNGTAYYSVTLLDNAMVNGATGLRLLPRATWVIIRPPLLR